MWIWPYQPLGTYIIQYPPTSSHFTFNDSPQPLFNCLLPWSDFWWLLPFSLIYDNMDGVWLSSSQITMWLFTEKKVTEKCIAGRKSHERCGVSHGQSVQGRRAGVGRHRRKIRPICGKFLIFDIKVGFFPYHVLTYIMLFFQVIELNNDRLMTNTEYKTLSPEWNKVFQVIKAKIDKKKTLIYCLI